MVLEILATAPRNKNYTDWKEIKLLLIVDDMIAYIENLTKDYKNLQKNLQN